MRGIQLRGRRSIGFATLAAALTLSGCGHHKKTAKAPQTAPDIYTYPERPSAPDRGSTTSRNAPPPATTRIPITPVPPGGVNAEDLEFVESHQPIETEVGYATWYSAPYKGRKSANGQVFRDDALTAAHRTLPMGSLVVVTNLKTGQSSAMRITDRGPFVDGRILDLTIASAKATGVYRQGLARVRIDVYQTPKPIGVGGRWCVQVGAFHQEDDALELKAQLQHRYPDATVIEFPGEASFWVRIRPLGDNREVAVRIAQWLKPVEGEAFLTRLD
jgi:rare lipoprotein A